MKVGVMSDTHENMPKISKAVEIFNEQGVEFVLHAGDIISPITFKEFKNLKSKFIGVFGNNDGERKLLTEKFSQIGEIHNKFYKTEIAGKKILLLHEPDLLDELITSQKFDIIVYGHTHIIDSRREGKTVVINPGEAGGWLHGKSTIAVLDTETLSVEIIEI